MIQLIVLLPLIAAVIAGLGNKALGKLPAKIITTGALFVSCALSWPIFIAFLTGHAEPYVAPAFTWIQSGSFDAQWALRVDAMTAVMLVVITSVSSLVHLYSCGYMEEEPDQPRFFAYLSLFTFAMLMLVTANNLLQMFFGWEGVGLASYLLIGFWFRKPSANAAANRQVAAPMKVTKPSAVGDTSNIGDRRHTMNTPAVTIVAAWISADTGVGPSIASGSQVWRPSCADFPIAPMNSSRQSTVMVSKR